MVICIILCNGQMSDSLSSCGYVIQIWKCSTCARPSCISEPMSRYPAHLSPNITPTKSGKAQKSRTRREPSGVFSLFQPQQIQQFKEAFSLIDQDRDGLVGERDLKDTFTSLGAHMKPAYRRLGIILHSPPHLPVQESCRPQR